MDPEFKSLVGKTFSHVTGKVGDDVLLFKTTEDEKFQLYHRQDCCESVYVEDICGNLEDLIGSPIIQADEASSLERPLESSTSRLNSDDSKTWTFYRIATAKGLVVIRWYGTSNGYYSERVDFEQIL